ncbi:NAD(P)/FAD-dependent oxidoreductase [Neolewinella antarctica]|uniref:Geranylgeranyl reductase family protein n=1 Tax=Neolewinella antarctica TaxID=442734 RepID=A0ABX0X699_9BACT|nr:geranylgeranyl reductase family protein [Neolewinella antarctica]NJC24539.1 geranylgeranyl reductase family protein [Neolewinella antarctica]
MQEFDIIVIGAGPGGSTFVRALRDSSLRIALIDKDEFPRDKICGDAIPGTAVSVGRRLDPDFWRGLPSLNRINGITVQSPSGISAGASYVTEGYTCTRLNFDDYLVKAALTNPRLTTFFGTRVKKILWEKGQTTVELPGGATLTAPMVVGADGAHSVVARACTETSMDRGHHAAAVRAYYRGVSGLDEDRLAAYLLTDFLPGYFWIFPLGGDLYNVGFGMLSRHVSESKIDLRTALDRIVRESPLAATHFAGAEQVSKNEGFGLPLGSRVVPRSGHGFVLLGDAAGLVDPASGEGIGNAMISAEIAADVVRSGFQESRLDAAFLKEYDRRVQKRLGLGFKLKYWGQLLTADRPWLLDGAIKLVAKNKLALWAITKLV